MKDLIAALPPMLYDAASLGRSSWVSPQRPADAVLNAIRDWTGGELTGVQKENLSALESGKALCVVTGQQPGLFLGPLFTLYKAVSAVRLARALSTVRKAPVVPIFWIHGEDHDRDEVNLFTAAVGSEYRQERLEFPEREGSPSLFDIPLPEFDRERFSSGTGDRLAEAVLGAYAPGISIPRAFAQALQAVFRDSGLLLFAIRGEGLAQLTAPIYRQALTEYRAIAADLQQETSRLGTTEGQPLIRLRDDSPLFFLRGEAAGSGRARLLRGAEDWHREGSPEAISDQSLHNFLEEDPGRFSSSALLRPVIQDTLFPTVAIVGGPAEVSYLRQTAPLYRRFGLQQPVIVARASYLLIDSKIRRLCAQLGAGVDTLNTISRDSLLSGDDAVLVPDTFRELVEQARAEFEDRLQKPLRHLPSLQPSLARTFEKFQRAAQSLQDLYRQTFDREFSTRAERVERLLALIRPGGEPQERALSALPYLERYGLELCKKLLEGAAPLIGAGAPFLVDLDAEDSTASESLNKETHP